ncbi:hypothetical protein ACRE_035400 [Hapsidospora chrysogenum ATCC 11550]|uniref:Uncharacterized protein n=1 Tax=Hapsidospora chrysogenum (strain ATCC 11550 / CBS 779.69 / DSM 880 / IAM 14645 / JCM 23072 / IMI 49137) TaxID=857340 RepID=A0A086T8E5_HAPC1|nr:hypothetical protein ACRE_035400 [Hapsidospora chrysogenum ATCC 11550]
MDDDDDDLKRPIPPSPRPKLEPPDPVVRIKHESGDLLRHFQMEGIPRAPTNLDSSIARMEGTVVKTEPQSECENESDDEDDEDLRPGSKVEGSE